VSSSSSIFFAAPHHPGRIVGDSGAEHQCDEGHIGPFDVILIDDDWGESPWSRGDAAGFPDDNWLKRWWQSSRDRALEGSIPWKTDHSTCCVVGDKILLFGGQKSHNESMANATGFGLILGICHQM